MENKLYYCVLDYFATGEGRTVAFTTIHGPSKECAQLGFATKMNLDDYYTQFVDVFDDYEEYSVRLKEFFNDWAIAFFIKNSYSDFKFQAYVNLN